MNKKFIIIIAILAGLCFWSRPPQDPDLGWHLAGGAWISSHLDQGASLVDSLPAYDFINTFNTRWHDYHWLGQIAMYKVYKVSGYTGLLTSLGIFMALLCIVLSTIYFKASRGAKNLVRALLILLPCFYLIYDVASVRPQIYALLFIALALVFLIDKPGKFEIPILFILAIVCANIHVYWIFIPFLWFCYRCLPRFTGRKTPAALYSWSGLFIISAAALISPYGLFGADLSLRGLLTNYALIWDYMHTPDYLQAQITELQSPFRRWGWVPFFLFTYFAIFIRSFSIKRALARIGDTAAAITGLILTLKGVKFIGIFAVIALPYAARRFHWWRLPITSEFLSRKSVQTTVTVVMGFYLFFTAVNTFPNSETAHKQIKDFQPTEACSIIASLADNSEKASGHVRIMTHFNYGGWCRWQIFQMRPALDARVTTDGRTQGLSPEQFKASFNLYSAKEGWPETLAKWRPDFIVASREHALSHILFAMPGAWQPAYAGQHFALFAPATKN